MMNPNWSDERYREHPEKEMKKKAFESKEGYRGSYEEHCKREKEGLPEPRHMRGEY